MATFEEKVMSEIKQVIVVRTDLRNTEGQKVRTGKLFAQVSHASMAFLTRNIVHRLTHDNGIMDESSFSDVELEWMKGIFTKVCLQVGSEKELLEVYEKAKESKLEVHLITDSGLTEFGGQKIHTCLAIGPDYSEKIDKITSGLKLY